MRVVSYLENDGEAVSIEFCDDGESGVRIGVGEMQPDVLPEDDTFDSSKGCAILVSMHSGKPMLEVWDKGGEHKVFEMELPVETVSTE